MFVLHGRTVLAVACAVGFAAGAGGRPAVSAQMHETGSRHEDLVASPPATRVARYFSADLTVRQWRFSASGARAPVGGPEVVFRIVRELRGARWVTALSADRGPGALIDTPEGPARLTNPFRVARVELAEGDAQPRVFGPDGRPVVALSPEDMRLVGAAATIRAPAGPGVSAGVPDIAFLASAGQRDERRAQLVRQFGPPSGRVRGLDRFVRIDGGGRHEVLATRDTALPVDISTAMSNGAQVRTTIAYERREGYGHLRRLMRTEHHFAGSSNGLAVTEVELANVVLSDEVRP